MVITLEKFYSMLIYTSRRSMPFVLNHLDNTCDGSPLNTVSQHEHLIIFDNRMSRSQSVSFLSNTLNLRLGVFNGIKKFLPFLLG